MRSLATELCPAARVRQEDNSPECLGTLAMTAVRQVDEDLGVGGQGARSREGKVLQTDLACSMWLEFSKAGERKAAVGLR